MRILVTGATGFLGRQVVEKLSRYHNVIGIGSEDDLRDPCAAKRVIYYNKPEVVIHLAALCGGISYNKTYPYDMIYSNLSMGINIINAAINYDIHRFVLLSTTCCYPELCQTPFKEKDIWSGYPEKTNGYYGNTKKILGEMCDAAREQFGYDYITIIPANLVGKLDRFDDKAHILPRAIQIIDWAKKNNEEAVFMGRPDITRDFLNNQDCASAIEICLDKYHEAGPINVGSGIEISMRELLYKIADQMEFPKEKIVWQNKLPGQPKRVLDISKVSSLGWSPKISIDESISQTIKDYNVLIHSPN